MDEILAATAERIFADHADDAEALWDAIEASGLTLAMAPEKLGGAGFTLKDGFGLVRLAGAATAGAPLAETLLASLLLSAAGAGTPDGALTVCVNTDRRGFTVPYADRARYVVRLVDGDIATFEPAAAERLQVAGYDPVFALDFTDRSPVASATAPGWLTPDVVRQLGALTRCAQLCGAMQRALELTLEHTSTREQFGRPLAKFQAIQHLLADSAGEIAAGTAALQSAVETVMLDGPPDPIAVATAKARCSEAAGIVAANAHQAHGAIGYTEEYLLARFSRRLWQWREDFGNETAWAIELGRHFSRPAATSLVNDVFGGPDA